MNRVAGCSLAVLLTSFGCAESSGGNGEANVGLSEAWSLESEGFICGGALLSSTTAILCERSDGRSVLTRYDLRGVGDGEELDAPTDVLRLWRLDAGDLIVLSDDVGSVYGKEEGGDEWKPLPNLPSPDAYMWRGALAAFGDGSVLARFDFLGQSPRDRRGIDDGEVEGDVHLLRLHGARTDTLAVLPFQGVHATVGRMGATDRHPYAPKNVAAGGGNIAAWAFGGDSLIHLRHIDTGERSEVTLRGAPASLNAAQLADAEERWLEEKSPGMREVYARILELSGPPRELPWIEALWVSPENDVWVGRAAIDGDEERVWEIHSSQDLRRVELPAHLTVILDVRGGTVLATNDARDVVSARSLNSR